MAVLGAGLGLCLAVNLVDPNVEGALGLCPFKAMTGGLDCPGCGTLRGVRALTRGDVVRAADHNLLTVLVVPLLLVALVSWWRVETGRAARVWRPPTTVAVALAVAVPVFWLVRNLPVGAWLSSGVT